MWPHHVGYLHDLDSVGLMWLHLDKVAFVLIQPDQCGFILINSHVFWLNSLDVAPPRVLLTNADSC